jgi:predicted nucleic acid-binding protein
MAVLALAQRYGLTFYDAAYLDLALREDLPIASLDRAMCDAAKQSGISRYEP